MPTTAGESSLGPIAAGCEGAAPPAGSRATQWWEWPSVLCLEAPAVALVWQELLAQTLAASPQLHHRGLLAIALWLSYAADRWIDAWFEPPTTARHRFAARYRWPLLLAWGVVLAGGLLWASLTLAAGEPLRCLVAVAASVGQVLVVARLGNRGSWARRLRRWSAAGVFAGGVLLFVLPRAQAPLGTQLAFGLALWGVINANLGIIAWAEGRAARGHGGGREPSRRARPAVRGPRALVVLAALFVGLAMLPGTHRVLALGPAAALLALGLVQWLASPDVELMHAWVDLAVALPALALLFAR